jgi:hypothetical protein
MTTNRLKQNPLTGKRQGFDSRVGFGEASP